MRSTNSDTLAHRQKAKKILTLQHNVITFSTEYLHKNTCNLCSLRQMVMSLLSLKRL